MKPKEILFIVCILIMLYEKGFSQSDPPYQIKEEYVRSKYLDTTRLIRIAFPKDYDQSRVYPVIYTLDGDYLFEMLTGYIQFKSYWNYIPHCILVAVPHFENRSRDLNVSYHLDKGISGDKFFQFFSEELVAWVDSNYNTSSFRSVVGHSFSGYFATQLLIHKAQLFQGFILFSPAIYEDVLPILKARIAEGFEKKHYMYLSTADNDLRGHIPLINNTKKILEPMQNTNFELYYDLIPNARHSSMIPKAMDNALDFLFKDYTETDQVFFENLESEGVDLYSYIWKKYLTIQEIYGIQIHPRLYEYQSVAEYCVEKGEYEKALKLADEMQLFYSKNAEIGEYIKGLVYETKKDYYKALEHYKIMYSLLSEDVVNKADFEQDIIRMEKKINEQKKR